jgi:hypothetical protein
MGSTALQQIAATLGRSRIAAAKAFLEQKFHLGV